MCNLYESVPAEQICQVFGVNEPHGDYLATIAPLRPGPFINGTGALVGQWGLIPPDSPTRRPAARDGRPLATNNARRERMATAYTFSRAWRTGQRCLIPAWSYDEPYWGTGKNTWWRFWRADGQPWALAGLWDEWPDAETGELVPSYTMITQNCDAHPLLKLMHKPDPKLAADKQDKRAVVPIEPADWSTWLTGTVEQASALIQLPALQTFRHAAADPARQVELPIKA